MSLDSSRHCQTCGTPLPSGATACPRDGTPVPDAGAALSTVSGSPVPASPQQASPIPAPAQAGPQRHRRESESEPDPLVGQRIGEYVVRQRLGSGGMGVVYEGEHTTIGSKAAIKLIREEHTRSPYARDLLTEARAATAIRHHGIIEVFGFGHQPGVGQYLVMEYLEGRPLNEVIRERAPLPPAEALRLLCEVLDALSAAHAVGVIHRDLKPSNIFVARQSNGAEYIKVLDFGLAKRSSAPDGTTDQTHSNLVVGTPQYMAPEQALCEPVGPRTDLYAVGVIAFELLTGQRPFPGRSHMEVVAHHLKSPPPVPSSIVPQPPELDELILRLLAKAPQDRPASASEVARELRALLESREGAGATLSRTLSRPVATVKPDEALAMNVSTATVSPTPSKLRPLLEAQQPRLPVRASRWKWVGMAGGTLALALAVGLVVSRGRKEPVPVAAAAPAPVPVAPAQPEARPPQPELQQPAPTPAPARAEAPARKKPARPIQSASAATRAPTPALLEPTPEPAAAGTGTLHVVVRGAWAEVWVDGQKLGRVPPQNRYTLAVGEHELELRNPNLAPYRQKVVILPNTTSPHTVDFTAAAQALSPQPP